jgi:hypothetical protein
MGYLLMSGAKLDFKESEVGLFTLLILRGRFATMREKKMEGK